MIYKYTFSADSVLMDGEYYHILLYATSMTSFWLQTDEYFREENGKVYKIGELSGTTKKLLYDFDFSIGDTLIPKANIAQGHREILSVGTIQFLDGIPRKFLTLECAAEFSEPISIVWIEGIEDIGQLFYTESFCSLAGDGSTELIRCFSTNGQTIYIRPDLEGCYITSVDNLKQDLLKCTPIRVPTFCILISITNKQLKGY